MRDILSLLLLAVLALGAIALGWWLLIESEGVYLGRNVVIWLYDLYADRYDDIKHFRQEYDHMFLSQPIMDLIAPHRSPLVLDVATGTGRLPIAMLHYAQFQGRVIGVDMSRRMLRKAAYKLGSPDPRAPLMWGSAEDVPFPDNTFDVVTCLEALEFMQDHEAVLREWIRVLRPGGLMLITNRIHTRLMPGKTRSDEAMETLLESLGMEDVVIEYWQMDYDRVFAWKPGEHPPTGAKPLAEVLRCPRCHEQLLVEQVGAWVCPTGHYRAPVGSDGVIELL